jgi:hypothetical protein
LEFGVWGLGFGVWGSVEKDVGCRVQRGVRRVYGRRGVDNDLHGCSPIPTSFGLHLREAAVKQARYI